MARQKDIKTGRRTRTKKIHWSSIIQKVHYDKITYKSLAESLGCTPGTISRYNSEIDENGFLNVSQEFINALKANGFQVKQQHEARNAGDFFRRYEALGHAMTIRDQKTALDELTRFSWSGLLLECTEHPNEAGVILELPEQLRQLRARVGVENWDRVAAAIAAGFTKVAERNLPNTLVNQLLMRLLEADTRIPLVARDGNLLPKILVADHPFMTIQSFALQTHLEADQSNVVIGLDAWPGYFPLWAARDQLRNINVSLVFIEDSNQKMKLLLEGRLQVIGTTPGSLVLKADQLTKTPMELLAVLNRSNGADKVLFRPRQDRNSARVLPPKAVFTSGSTSELLFRAYENKNSQLRGTRRVKSNGYLETALAITQDPEIEYVSTWEPYASLLCESVKDLRVVATTESQPEYDVVADYLISPHATTSPQLRSIIDRVLHIWDRTIKQEKYLKPRFLKSVAYNCNDTARAYLKMMKQVSYFTTAEMTHRLESEDLLQQLKRVASVAGVSASSANRLWDTLLHAGKSWLSRAKDQ